MRICQILVIIKRAILKRIRNTIHDWPTEMTVAIQHKSLKKLTLNTTYTESSKLDYIGKYTRNKSNFSYNQPKVPII